MGVLVNIHSVFDYNSVIIRFIVSLFGQMNEKRLISNLNLSSEVGFVVFSECWRLPCCFTGCRQSAINITDLYHDKDSLG